MLPDSVIAAPEETIEEKIRLRTPERLEEMPVREEDPRRRSR